MEDIGVIIPLYNGEKWIQQTLDSVLSQSIKPKQIIVVDDGSTDSSAQVVSAIKGVTLVKNTDPGGATKARNFGLRQVDAAMVAFLDQDDVWHPDHLRLLSKILTDNPKAAAAAAQYEMFNDGDSPAFDIGNQNIEPVKQWDTYPFADAMEPSLILFRRWVFDKFEWAHEMEGCSDRYLWHQVSVHYPIIRFQARTVARRIHQSSGYHALIKKNPLDHFKKLIHLTDSLLEYHLQFVTEDDRRKHLQKRASIMRIIPDLIKSIIKGDTETLKRDAVQLEAILKDDNRFIRKKTFEKLFLAMTHHNEGIKSEILPQQFHEFIGDHWPADCKLTRSIIESQIIENRPGLSFYLRNISRHPLQLNRYNLMAKAIKTKVFK